MQQYDHYTDMQEYDPEGISNKICITHPSQLRRILHNKTPLYHLEILFIKKFLDNSDIELLTDYLKSEIGRQVKVLYIMCSGLNNDQAKLLIDGLDCDHDIEYFSLFDNNLNNDLEFLCGITKLKSSLRVLNLSGNDLSNNIKHIVTILNDCLLLEMLDLTDCNLNDQDVENLCDCFKTCPNLTVVSLLANQSITYKSLEYANNFIELHNKIENFYILDADIVPKHKKFIVTNRKCLIM